MGRFHATSAVAGRVSGSQPTTASRCRPRHPGQSASRPAPRSAFVGCTAAAGFTACAGAASSEGSGWKPPWDSSASCSSGSVFVSTSAARILSRSAGSTAAETKAVMKATSSVSPTTRMSPFLMVPQPSSSGAA